MISNNWEMIKKRVDMLSSSRIIYTPYERAREQIKQHFKIEEIVVEDEIAFSYHRDCIGKPERRLSGPNNRPELWIGNKKINLGYGWQTVSMPYSEFFVMLSEGGYALGPALTSDHRDENNFVSHQLALVDIDGGMTLESLPSFDFYQQYGSGFYTTPSHTEKDQRFRLIYRLEQPITDAEQMRELYEGLLAIHGAADISCKDPARLFFGTVGSVRKECTTRILNAHGVQQALAARTKILAVKVHSTPTNNNVSYSAPDLAEVQKTLDDLRKHYQNLCYKQRFAVTRAVAAHIGTAQTVTEMRSRWPDQDKTAKYEDLLQDPLTAKGPKLGSLVYMIRDMDPTYRKKLEVPPKPNTEPKARPAPQRRRASVLIELPLLKKLKDRMYD